MEENICIQDIKEDIQTAMELAKCRKCGCMKESLKTIKNELVKASNNDFSELFSVLENSIEKLEPSEYTLLGCKKCWSADITNAFDEVFSELNSVHSIENDFLSNDNLDTLPAVGEYHVLSLGDDYPVAISTLGSIELADKISGIKPGGLSIVGKTETENIGVEKIIKNVIATPSIKYLILCGKESKGHLSGNTLVSLVNNGVDDKMKVIDSKGKKPILSNTTKEEVDAFRNQIEVIDMIECEDLNKILEKIIELSVKVNFGYTFDENASNNNGKLITQSIQIIKAKEKDPNKVKLDKAGYFVIVPKVDNDTILVEHYSYNNKLLRIIKGVDARDIYWNIIDNGWVTEMSHAAYLGKELIKAEMSIKLGFKYIQDKA